jgi:hypothetical protein
MRVMTTRRLIQSSSRTFAGSAPAWIPLLLAAPIDLKLGEEIQTYILARRRPEFLRVTNANTGAIVGASLWTRTAATLQMKIFAKLGVPGYQPYEKLGLWLRRELAPVVRDILLDPQTLDRGVYQAAGIKAVVQQHLEQGRNHTYLLMALMIFELGLRRLVDHNVAMSDIRGNHVDPELPAPSGELAGR